MAGVVITAAVVLGVTLLHLLQIQAVHRTIDGQLRTYATQMSQSAAAGTWPAVLPPSTLDGNTQAQVVDADGRVVAATRTLLGVPAIYLRAPSSDAPVRQKAADGVVPTEIRVVALHQHVAGQPFTVIAGTSTSLLTQLRSASTSNLLLGFPVILLTAAAAVWLIVGRALRPVEQIRQAVTDTTSADLSRRVPEPGTPDEIGHLAHTMNQMLTRLEDSARRQRGFVADASDELRSPLAAIRTTLEVGLAHPDTAPWPVIARRAADQSNRLEALIQQLLVLAKADGDLLAGDSRPVDTNALLRELCSTAPAGHVRTSQCADPDLDRGGYVTGTPEHLDRLFRNVLDNAVRYAHSAVTITTAATHGQVCVVISDDGPGIPPKDRERIFHRFVRLDSSRGRHSGTTGLGLAIARQIADAHAHAHAHAHAGRIDIDDAPRGGAQVTITLPHRSSGAVETASSG